MPLILKTVADPEMFDPRVCVIPECHAGRRVTMD